MRNVAVATAARQFPGYHDEKHRASDPAADREEVRPRANLEVNPKVAVTVVDPEKKIGYQFKGKAKLVDDGPLYSGVKEELEKAPRAMPRPRYVVRITVEQIYDQSPGPNAGRRLG